MGQLVFIRLLFHHLAGHLLGLADLKTRLFSYIDAIKDQLSLYQAYPGVLLCFQTILCVGEIIIGPYNVFKSSEEVSEISFLLLCCCCFCFLSSCVFT